MNVLIVRPEVKTDTFLENPTKKAPEPTDININIQLDITTKLTKTKTEFEVSWLKSVLFYSENDEG